MPEVGSRETFRLPAEPAALTRRFAGGGPSRAPCGCSPRARPLRDAASGPWSVRPFVRRHCGPSPFCGEPQFVPGATTLPSMPFAAAHASELRVPLAIAVATGACGAGPHAAPMPHSPWSVRLLWVAEKAASRRRGVLSTSRSQSPASSKRRHACLRGRGGSPRGRTLRPGSTARVPHASTCGRA